MPFNTRNPIPSGDLRDLDDNARNIDTWANDKTKASHPDRFGVERYTWHGIEQKALLDLSDAVADATAEAGQYRDQALDAKNAAQEAAMLSGFSKYADTLAQLESGIGTDYVDGDLVMVFQDETRGGTSSIFEIESGAAEFKQTFDKTRQDLLSFTGNLSTDAQWSDVPAHSDPAFDVQAQALANRTELLNAAVPLTAETYDDLRAYTGTASAADITKQGISGRFYRSAGAGSDDGATCIVDAKGRVWLRDISGDIQAAWWGFAESKTGSVNADAVTAAVLFAGKRKVVANAVSEFEMDRLRFTDEDVNLEFTGGGSLRKRPGGSVLHVLTPFTDINPITSITNTTYVIEGNNEKVTAIATSGAPSYSVGDVVKIVSDDIDTSARQGYTARRGEIAYVVAVDSANVYVSGPLEDQIFYVTNPRIGKIQQKMLSVSLPIIQSERGNSTSLVIVQGRYKPEISGEVIDHGAIVCSFSGCVRGKVKFSGSTKGDSSTSLGYLFQDSSGTDNLFYDSFGQRCRHMVTTSYNSVAEGSTDLRLFGPPRDLVVRDCTAESSQNVPFDDHEGSRRTQFINCKARGFLLGTNSHRAAFQARGFDTSIINPQVDSTFEYVLHASSVGGGTHKIIGGHAFSKAVTTDDNGNPKPTVILDNLTCHVNDSGNGFIGSRGLSVVVKGGNYIADRVSTSFARVWGANSATIILDNPIVFINAIAAPSFRWMLAQNGAFIIGKMTVINSSGDFSGGQHRIFVALGENPGRVDVDIDWIKGTRPTPSSTEFTELRYRIKDYSTTPVTVLSSP